MTIDDADKTQPVTYIYPATMGTGTLRIEAYEYSDIYYKEKADGVRLTAGKYYQSRFALEDSF